MKVLLLSAYPRVDRLHYKNVLLEGLVDRNHEVKILYSGIRSRDYTQEARRRGMLRPGYLLGRFRGGGNGAAGGEVSSLPTLAERKGVEVVRFTSLGSDETLDFVRRFAPDHTINLAGMFIPGVLLDSLGGRVVGGHYGDLPRFRGRDTVRWPILVDHPTVVSHMYLARKYDMGDVLLKSTVTVRRGQPIEEIRRACQTTSVRGHLAVVDAFVEGRLEPRPQHESEGTTFYEMGTYLRGRVDDILRDGRYESGEVGDS